MEQYLFWLQDNAGLDPGIQGKILSSLLIVLVLWGLRQLLLSGMVNRIEDLRLRYRWRKTLTYVFFVLGVLLVGPVWFDGIQSVATYLGLLSAGLAIALRDVITDFLGWIYLMWRKPLDVGDRVQVGDHVGDVIDQGVFQFTLMEVGEWVNDEQSTGRLLYIPNSMAFRAVVANYSKGLPYIWNEISLLLAFDSNWGKAKQLLLEIAVLDIGALENGTEAGIRKIADRYLIQRGKLTPVVYTSVKENGILLTLRYLCEPRQRRDSTHRIWENILRTFANHKDIRFANQEQAVLVVPEGM